MAAGGIEFMEVKNKIVEQLLESELFSGMAFNEVADILGNDQTSVRAYKKGEQIIDPSTFKPCMAYVLTGKLVIREVDNGMVFKDVPKGSFFALITLFNDSLQFASNIFAVRDSRIIFFSQDLVDECVSSYPQFARNYIRYLHTRMRFMHSEIMVLSRNTPKNSLIGYLWNSSASLGEQFRLEASYSDLARNLNMSRSSLYRILDELEGEGFLTRKGRYITINRVLEY